MRSKRELIETFINESLDGIDPQRIEEEFEVFVDKERKKSFKALVDRENLIESELGNLIENYLYDGREPLKDDVRKTLRIKPKLLESRIIVPRVLSQINKHVETYYHF